MNDDRTFTWRDWRDPAVFITCGFGSGFVPIAPGTFGSLAAVIVWWWLLQPLGMVAQLIIILVITVLGTWLIGRVRERYGVGDPGAIVIDEFAGQWIVLLALPLDPFTVLLGFGLFRLFDIWKPWPIGWLERRVGGPFGVMIDDLVAGILGLGVLQFTLWVRHAL